MTSDTLHQTPLAGILWDMDGTLADSEPVHKLSFERACDQLRLHLPAGFHEVLLGSSEEDTHAWLIRECGLDLPLHDWMICRFSAYHAHIEQVVFHPHAKQIWDQARDLGIPQAIVSNSDRIIVSANLDQLGLSLPGLISVSRNDVLRGKPHPDPYLRGAELLGIAPEHAAIVEDSQTGLSAGLAAGMSAYVMPHYEGEMTASLHPLSALAARVAGLG